MFRLLRKKNSNLPPLCLYNEFAEFSANEIREEKKKRGEVDQRDSVGGGASHRATCECEHKSKLAAT